MKSNKERWKKEEKEEIINDVRKRKKKNDT